MAGGDHVKEAIITAPELFEEDTIPARMQDREEQSRRIQRHLAPALTGDRAIHTWVYGPPGSGKTTVVRKALNEFNEKTNTKTVWTNCWCKRTLYEVLDEIIEKFQVLRAEEHRTGYRIEKLRQFLKGRPFVIVLDEAEQAKPGELSTILYNLEYILNAGIICIANLPLSSLNLDQRVLSRLSPTLVDFQAYSTGVLMEILRFRAETALRQGSWTSKDIETIAAYANGDARCAIKILNNAALVAQQQGQSRISTEGLLKQLETAKQARVTGILDRLTKDHRLLYSIIRQKGSMLSGDLWHEYLDQCEQLTRKPISSRTFAEYVNRLIRSKLVKSERARVRGNSRLLKVAN